MIYLAGRTFLRLSGPDRTRYLNGQVTNDVAKLQPGQAIQACVTNSKGKLEAEIFIRRHGVEDEEGGESLLVDAPQELREDLLARLEKYLIADDCELCDVSDQFALFHSFGRTDEALPAQFPHTSFATRRFGTPGLDFLTPSKHAGAIHDSLTASHSLLGEEELLLHCIRHRVPVWGRELTPGILPPEAGLDATAIDYHKGCYIGQEVISRIRSVGRVNRRLQLLVSTDVVEECEVPFMKLGDSGPLTILSSGDSPSPIGQVTSIARDPADRRIHALGYVKRGHESPGTTVLLRRADEFILPCPFEIRNTREN